MAGLASIVRSQALQHVVMPLVAADHAWSTITSIHQRRTFFLTVGFVTRPARFGSDGTRSLGARRIRPSYVPLIGNGCPKSSLTLIPFVPYKTLSGFAKCSAPQPTRYRRRSSQESFSPWQTDYGLGTNVPSKWHAMLFGISKQRLNGGRPSLKQNGRRLPYQFSESCRDTS